MVMGTDRCRSNVSNAVRLRLIPRVIFVGALLGFTSNLHQQRLYAREAQRQGGHAPPEARLYWATIGGLLFPIGMFAFAWTGRPDIHWIVPMIALCIANWGVYAMFSGVLYVYIPGPGER
jgi:hypothetical protein